MCLRRAAVTSFNLTDHNSGLTATTIAPGASITMDLGVKSDTPFNGVSVFLDANTPLPGQFVAITRTTATWPQNGSTDSLTSPIVPSVSAANGAIPKTGNSIDFGYVSTNLSADLPADSSPGYSLETLTFTTPATLAPGTYTISTTIVSELNTSPTSGSNEFSVPVATFSVTVMPEPATMSMGLMGRGGTARR